MVNFYKLLYKTPKPFICNATKTENTGLKHLYSLFSSSSHHIFNKNPVSFRRIIDKYMGHCADQFAVLNHR